MSNGRYIHQASEKVVAVCRAMHAAGSLAKANIKSLSSVMDVNYSTFKSAVQAGSFTPAVEAALSRVARFDVDHPSWIDAAVNDTDRRFARPDVYRGEDTIERFRVMLASIWTSGGAAYRATQKSYAAFDPHMMRHEISDVGQATQLGMSMQMFATMHFEPFYHHSGIRFGFRRAALTVDFYGGSDVHSAEWFGYPSPARLRNATLKGDRFDRSSRWVIEAVADGTPILEGEYATTEHPLFAIRNVQGGTAIVSRVEVNLFDRTTCVAQDGPDLDGNKQALIEQIFSNEFASANASRGWVTLSTHEAVVARYER